MQRKAWPQPREEGEAAPGGQGLAGASTRGRNAAIGRAPLAATTSGPDCVSQRSVSAASRCMLPTPAGLGDPHSSCTQALKLACATRELAMLGGRGTPMTHPRSPPAAGMATPHSTATATHAMTATRTGQSVHVAAAADVAAGVAGTEAAAPSGGSRSSRRFTPPQAPCALAHPLVSSPPQEECPADPPPPPSGHRPGWASLPTSSRALVTSSGRERQEGIEGGDFWRVVRTKSDQALLEARAAANTEAHRHTPVHCAAARAEEQNEAPAWGYGASTQEREQAMDAATLGMLQHAPKVDRVHMLRAPVLGVLRQYEPLIMASHVSGIKKRKWGCT